MNKQQQTILRAVFDAEVFVENARTVSPKLYDSRDEMVAKVNRVDSAGMVGISVELIASRGGWEVFVNYLFTKGYCADTRRWNSFSETLYRYDLYVSGADDARKLE